MKTLEIFEFILLILLIFILIFIFIVFVINSKLSDFKRVVHNEIDEIRITSVKKGDALQNDFRLMLDDCKDTCLSELHLLEDKISNLENTLIANRSSPKLRR